MKRFALTICFPVALMSCDRRQTNAGASNELKSEVGFQVTALGKASDRYREMDLYDYEVSIVNNSMSSFFLLCSTPEAHSEYIVKRNPETINYTTIGIAGAQNLTNRGLMGPGRPKELKQGEKLSFIAPMPVIPGHDQPGEFKIQITLYLDPEDINSERTIMSLPLTFNPSG